MYETVGKGLGCNSSTLKQWDGELHFFDLDAIELPVAITKKEEDEPQICSLLAPKPFMRTIKIKYSSQRNVCKASVGFKVFPLVLKRIKLWARVIMAIIC